MSSITCSRCESVINTDYDDDGLYFGTTFLCGSCCDELLDKVPGEGGKVANLDILEAFKNEK